MQRRALGLSITLTLMLAACDDGATSPADVRARLSAARYVLGEPSPDPRAADFPGVVSSECYDATQNGGTVHICVWMWPGPMPSSFPLEDFTERERAITESHGPCFVSRPECPA